MQRGEARGADEVSLNDILLRWAADMDPVEEIRGDPIVASRVCSANRVLRRPVDEDGVTKIASCLLTTSIHADPIPE